MKAPRMSTRMSVMHDADEPPGPPPVSPLEAVVADLDRHAAAAGWDRPPRLYALVATSDLLHREPQLATELGLAADDPTGLTPVEQEALPSGAGLEESLAQVAWPPEVLGTALVVERIVVPAEAEREMPQDETEALRWLAGHPQRGDVRMTVGVLRDGRRAAALRLRSHDRDDAVLRGPDLVPALADALAATLQD